MLYARQHVNTNLKKFLVQNLTRLLYLPIPSSVENWKIFTNKVCQVFFARADILSEKNPYFGEHLFAKQELITRARLRVQDFGTGENFCFNQCRVFSFFLGKVIL